MDHYFTNVTVWEKKALVKEKLHAIGTGAYINDVISDYFFKVVVKREKNDFNILPIQKIYKNVWGKNCSTNGLK